MEYKHIPVLKEKVLFYLNLKEDGTYVDATLGEGGHAQAILERLGAGGRLIGIDQDEQELLIAKRRLKRFGSKVTFIQDNFKDLDLILGSLKVKELSGIFFDLGLSSFQLDDLTRGFSFRFDAPLDMRRDRKSKIRAADLINGCSEREIEDIIRRYGEERWAKRIAKFIVKERRVRPIVTTSQLVNIIEAAIPKRFWSKKIHPATKTFQALRIAVNQELEALEEGLRKGIDFLARGGRIVVLSFHSLEDRIVKLQFRQLETEGRGRKTSVICHQSSVIGQQPAEETKDYGLWTMDRGLKMDYGLETGKGQRAEEEPVIKVLTRKPVAPDAGEITLNIRARSAKLRAAEKV